MFSSLQWLWKKFYLNVIACNVEGKDYFRKNQVTSYFEVLNIEIFPICSELWQS